MELYRKSRAESSVDSIHGLEDIFKLQLRLLVLSRICLHVGAADRYNTVRGSKVVTAHPSLLSTALVGSSSPDFSDSTKSASVRMTISNLANNIGSIRSFTREGDDDHQYAYLVHPFEAPSELDPMHTIARVVLGKFWGDQVNLFIKRHVWLPFILSFLWIIG
jgi:hypothetical protein